MTFVKSMDQLPEFTDYNMKGRTYRFMDEEPLYRFGYGLSYTTFAYGGLSCDSDGYTMKDADAGKPIEVSVEVKNSGERDGRRFH